MACFEYSLFFILYSLFFILYLMGIPLVRDTGNLGRGAATLPNSLTHQNKKEHPTSAKFF